MAKTEMSRSIIIFTFFYLKHKGHKYPSKKRYHKVEGVKYSQTDFKITNQEGGTATNIINLSHQVFPLHRFASNKTRKTSKRK